MLSQMMAQSPTVGLLEIDHELVSEGYTLFCPYLSSNFYLINNCGEKINEWNTDLTPQLKMGYLDAEGNLLILNGRQIRKYDWDSNLIWQFTSGQYGIQAHHDFEIMPNGNILTIAREVFSYDEAIEIGFPAASIQDTFIMIDGLYEFQHLENNDFELVWKWNFKDHLVQDVNNDAGNYGIVLESPRKLDVNYSDPIQAFDWLHCNGVNYNEELDQIIVSSRNTSEIYIIDHSTSIEEAASSIGGNQGFGGDFLWRWGNQNLMGQHDPNWIPTSHPYGGMISVFNNLELMAQDPFSSIKIIDPHLDAQGKYQLDTFNQFLPQDPHLNLSGEETGIYSPFMSGTHSQANGNFIICLGNFGTFYELTTEGEIAWKYQNPVSEVPQTQFTPAVNSLTFNIRKYPLSFSGFDGKDLSPDGFVEDQNPYSEACILNTNIEDINNIELKVFPNPSAGKINFESEEPVEQIQIFALSGKRVALIKEPRNSIDVTLKSGSYIFQFNFKDQLINQLVIVNQ